MPVPPFILELRRHVGTAELWLPGVTAVIRRSGEILLVRRADNGQWSPVTGIVDPGEELGVTARREAREEAGVEIRVDRLASVSAGQRVRYPNGDRAVFLDHTFSCTWLGGDAHVADDESTEVGWFRRDRLPEMQPLLLERIEVACSEETRTRFAT